jgi:hypothetical protein
MSIWGEIREDIDEDTNIADIFGYMTADDNEAPVLIAIVLMNTGTVQYVDERAKTDSYAQEMIAEILEDQ